MESLTLLQKILIWAIPVIFAITVHEVSHGYIASKLGDKTALMLGRITLNPLKHIDLFGTIIVPAFLLTVGNFIFGWAKPVPVDYRNLKNPKVDSALVAAAGPISNFLMACIWALILKLGTILHSQGFSEAYLIIYMGQAGIMVNIVLGVLNLLPIPPLDGSHVVASVLPDALARPYMRLQIIGFILIVTMIYFGWLSAILAPPVKFFFEVVVTVFGIK